MKPQNPLDPHPSLSTFPNKCLVCCVHVFAFFCAVYNVGACISSRQPLWNEQRFPFWGTTGAFQTFSALCSILVIHQTRMCQRLFSSSSLAANYFLYKKLRKGISVHAEASRQMAWKCAGSSSQRAPRIHRSGSS